MFKYFVCRYLAIFCINCLAVCCWTGLKYASENENDLKDKMDFVQSDPDHYPPGGKTYGPKGSFVR